MAEVFYGIALLPAGRRKADLAADAQRMFRDDFGPRLLAFDTDAAVHYGAILAERSRATLTTSPANHISNHNRLHRFNIFSERF
jgi:predicted nucleic acid-binding protein